MLSLATATYLTARGSSDDDDHCKTYGFTGSIVPATGPRESRLFP
jgi:hypothetical protein